MLALSFGKFTVTASIANEDATDDGITSMIHELGHQLGLTVVAEGVETEAVFADLRRLGCDTVQGYLFSRPVPACEALALMDRPYVTSGMAAE